MGDILPYDEERVVAEIKWELDARSEYRRGGRPCPYPLPDVETKIRALERMEPALRRQVNIELTQQALQAMERIYDAHLASISKDSRTYKNGGY